MTIHSNRAALRLCLAAASLAFSSLAGAVSLSLSPWVATAPPTTVGIDVLVSDVAIGKAVGAYDITLSYDASVWSATSVDFDRFLNGADPFGSMAAADLTVAGQVLLQEVSFITPLDAQPLDVLQPQSFRLATVQFTALSQGTGAFAIQQAALFDELGDGMAISAVPEPGTAAFALLGLAGLVAHGTRTRRRLASAAV